MSLIETIRAKLVNYKADLVEFPYEFTDKKLIKEIKNSGMYADSKYYLKNGSIVFINKHIIAISVDKNIHSSIDTDFLDIFIDLKNNIIAFNIGNNSDFSFNRILLNTLHDENMFLVKSVAKEVMPTILAMRLIS